MNTKKMVLAAMFTALTVVGGVIALPIGAVPVTFQVVFCFLSGALLGARYGALAQFIYVLLGAIGLPVFAGFTGGIGVLAGPTGGYIVGFIIATYVIGKLTEHKNYKFIGYAVSMLVGLAIIYILGTIQLAFVLNIGAKKAILAGVAPFIVFDLIKLVVASVIAVGAKNALRAANLLPE